MLMNTKMRLETRGIRDDYDDDEDCDDDQDYDDDKVDEYEGNKKESERGRQEAPQGPESHVTNQEHQHT